jgi:hypothetical protein
MRPRLQPSFEFGLTTSNLSDMLFADVVIMRNFILLKRQNVIKNPVVRLRFT